MADSLKIDIDVSAAKAALDALSGSFDAFEKTASKSTSGAATAVQRLNDAMANIKGIDSAVLSSLSTLNQTLAALNAGSITTLSQALSGLSAGTQTVQQTAQATQALGQALNSVKTPEGLNSISVNFKNTSAAAQDADAHVKAFYKNQAQDAATSAKAAAQAQKEVQAAFNRTQNSIKALGTELINAAGFMGGFGVTAGKIVSILADLSKSGETVGSVFQSLKDQFGTFGAVAAVFSGVATAVKGLSSAVQSVLDPIVQVGQSFQSFKNVIDAIDGSGAGAKTLDALQKISADTAQSIDVLTNNYKGFRAATNAAGVSSEQSLKIFKSVTGAMGALGQSSEQTEKAILALTQMFSKGKVQAEELRGQLGDAMPGAFQLFAQAANMSTAQLDAFLKAGKAVPTELIPKFAELLDVKYGDAVAKQTQTARGALVAFGNAITNLQNALAQGNFGGVLAGVANGMAQINKALDSPAIQEAARAIGDLLGLFTNTVLSTIGGFVQGFTAVFDAVASVAKAFENAISPVTDFINEVTGGNVVMGTLSDVAAGVGKVLGVLASVWVITGGATKAYAGILSVTSSALVETGAAAKAMGVDISGLSDFLVGAAGKVGEFVNAFTSIEGIKGVFSGAKAAVSEFITFAIQGFKDLQAGVTSFSFTALIEGFKASGIAAKAASIGIEAFKLAIKGIVFIAAIEFITNLIPLVEKAAAAFGNWIKSLDSTKESMQSFQPIQEQVAKDVESFSETIAKTPEQIFNMADAFGTLQRAQSDAKGTLSELEGQLKTMQEQEKQSSLDSREAARRTQDYTDAIKDQIAAVQEQKSAAQARDRAADQALKQQEAETKLTRDSTNEKQSAVQADRQRIDTTEQLTHSYEGYNEQLKNLRDAERDVQDQAKDRERNEQAWRDSLKESEDAIQQQIASIKEWGVALDNGAQAIANELVAFGDDKKAAAELAYAYQQATKSRADLAQEADAAIQKDKAEYELKLKLRDAIAQKAKADYDAVIAAKGGEAAAEAAAKANNDLVKSLDDQLKKKAELIIAEEAQNKIQNEGVSVNDAIKQAVDDVTASLGLNVDKAKLAQDAQQALQDRIAGTTDATNKNKEATDSWGETIKGVISNLFKTSENSKTTATNITAVADAMSGAQKTLDSGSTTIGTLADGFTKLNEQSQQLVGALPGIGDAFSTISNTIPDLTDALVKLLDPFNMLTEDVTTLSEGMPIISQGFTDINTAVATDPDAFTNFVNTLGRIPSMSDGIKSTSDAFISLITAISNAVDVIKTASDNLTKLGDAGNGVRTGLNNAIDAGDNFIRELDNINNAIEATITEMKNLKKAAEEALDAASKARQAQVDANNTGGGDTAQSGRYGGMAGGLPETVNAPADAFNNAPHFKDGTANTSSYISKVGGNGGIPSILHPNEAVVPLPKGRKIPVDLKVQEMPNPNANPAGGNADTWKETARGLTDVSKSLSQVAEALKAAPQSLTDAVMQPQQPQIIMKPEAPNSAQLNQPPQGRTSVNSSPDGLTPSLDSRVTNSGGTEKTITQQQTQNINITIQTQDADSFKRSKDQVAKQLSDSIKKANRRIG